MNQGKWLILAASLALVLLAAKSHGRQIRLERERAGYWKVVFGARNPPFVEALWRQDRILFWSVFGAGVAMALIFAWAAARFSRPMPLSDVRGSASSWVLILVAAVWPFAAAFIVSGLASLARLARSLSAAHAPENPPADPWLRNAWQGSLAWWIPTLALAIAIGLAAFRKPS
jgi:hypothetical protein